MTLHRWSSVLFLLASVGPLAASAHATTVTQVTSASQLSPNDTAFVDKSPAGTVLGSPASFVNGNNRLTFSRASGVFETDVVGYNYGQSAFSDGTVLVGGGGFQGPGDGGAITIKFAVPVIQFGMNIEDFEPAANHYNIGFYALDAAGNIIGNTGPLGNVIPALYSSAGCGDNSCLSFEGMTVTGDAISSLIIGDSGSGGGSGDLMFGNIKYAVSGTALQAPPTVTPEPSSIALLGTGILSLAAFTRRVAGSRRNSSAR